MASWPLLAALALVALITAARLTGTVDSDVAWQLWIAGRLHEGADLYRDIIETNPPLWFWMAVPVERLASLLHVRIESALIVAIGCLGALSLAATSRFLRHLEPSPRAMFLCAIAIMLCAMPWMHVGQREQIVMIGALPYAALIAARRDGRAIPALLALAIGAAAGLGFALKHYFLIVPLLLELWLIAGFRRRWHPLRPETLAMAGIGAAYSVAIVLIERDFLVSIVPLLTQAYGSFAAPSVRHLFGLPASVAVAILLVLGLHARALRQAPIASAIAIAAMGFAGAYFIQFKGWPYHALAMLGCASMALAALLAESKDKLRLLRLGGPALLCLPLSVSAGEAMRPTLPDADLMQAISDLPPATPVGFISEDTAIAWSVTLQHHFAYPSRYNGFWMLSSVYRNEQAGSPDARLTALGTEVVANTVADFRCMPPRRILVSRPRKGSWNEHANDPLTIFMRNPEFAEFLRHYRVTGRTSLEVYELAKPFPANNPAGCIRGH